MAVHSCCKSKGNRSRNVLQQSLKVSGWLLPGAGLVLMPKCPVCLAGYVTLLTGAGLSVSRAAQLRVLFSLFLIGLLLTLVVLFFHRIVMAGMMAESRKPDSVKSVELPLQSNPTFKETNQ